MILEIDTQFLIDNKITAHQFIIAKLVSENNITLLRKYITYTGTLNDIFKDLKQLKEAGFISSAHDGNIISLETIKISSKFTKLQTFSEDPFDEFYNIFPTKALRPDGFFDYLRVDQNRCRKLYHNIVRTNPLLHEHIMRCLRNEVEEKTRKGQMTFMKRMPAWLTSESWKAYDDGETGRTSPTLEANTQTYGHNIE
jgi:hypothetical protein